MDLIKRGLHMGRTIKNVARFREIVSVLARNGFDEFIIKTGMDERIPNFVVPKSRLKQAIKEYDDASWAESIAYRLRKSFEELGPSFVKLGQLLSTREDLFPEAFVEEMRLLQDKVKGIPFDEAKASIESSLGQPLEDVFSEFDDVPIGTASIGVVYKAKLKTGEPVVVKVRRPRILQTIQTDFSLLGTIITQIERVSAEIRSLGLSQIVADFGSFLETELDYRVEALNCDRLRERIQEVDADQIFYLPKVFHDHSTDEILVLEFLDGIPFSDVERISPYQETIREKLETGIRVFIHNILVDGFFHADLHGGNFFLLKDFRIGLVDFGLVGTLSRRSRANLVAILYSLLTNNYENLVYEFLDVAEYDSVPDVDALTRDIKQNLAPFVGLTVQQINLTVMFRCVLSTLATHHLYLPREWFIVFRAMIALDGVGRSLHMDFDIFGIVEQDIKEIIGEFFNKEQLTEEGLWLGRDVIHSMRAFPRHMRWFLREYARNNYAFKVKQSGYEDEIKSVSRGLVFLGFSMMAAILALSGVLLLGDTPLESFRDVPRLSWIFWILSFTFFSISYLKTKSK